MKIESLQSQKLGKVEIYLIAALFSLCPEQFNTEGVPLGLILILVTFIGGYFPVRVPSTRVPTETL